ncbi:hypothetical protein JCM10449v2_003468 [Rhodotorula kratochvilovae]
MATGHTGDCLVCGETTKNVCADCRKAGIDLFFCSKEHQKLVWQLHKKFCGPGNANPFRWPDLQPKEAASAWKNRGASDDADTTIPLAQWLFIDHGRLLLALTSTANPESGDPALPADRNVLIQKIRMHAWYRTRKSLIHSSITDKDAVLIDALESLTRLVASFCGHVLLDAPHLTLLAHRLVALESVMLEFISHCEEPGAARTRCAILVLRGFAALEKFINTVVWRAEPASVGTMLTFLEVHLRRIGGRDQTGGKLDHDFLASIEPPSGRTPYPHLVSVFHALMFSPRGTESRALSSKAWAQVVTCSDKDLQTENRAEAQQLVQEMGEAVRMESALSQRIWEVMRGQ